MQSGPGRRYFIRMLEQALHPCSLIAELSELELLNLHGYGKWVEGCERAFCARRRRLVDKQAFSGITI